MSSPALRIVNCQFVPLNMHPSIWLHRGQWAYIRIDLPWYMHVKVQKSSMMDGRGPSVFARPPLLLTRPSYWAPRLQAFSERQTTNRNTLSEWSGSKGRQKPTFQGGWSSASSKNVPFTDERKCYITADFVRLKSDTVHTRWMDVNPQCSWDKATRWHHIHSVRLLCCCFILKRRSRLT